MNAPGAASVFTLAREHAQAATLGLGVLLVAAALWFAYESGRSRGEVDTKVAAYDAYRDTLAVRDVHLRLVQDSLKRASAVAHEVSIAAVANARSERPRLVIRRDTALLQTASGTVAYELPHAVAAQITLERATYDAAIAKLTNETSSKDAVITADSVTERNLRESLATAAREIAELKHERRPRLRFVHGVLSGLLMGAAVAVAL